MLDIYTDIRTFQLDARTICQRIASHDASLANQLRRAAQSVALNLGEGMASSGGMRRKAYAIALGEARECRVAIDLAETWGYTDRPDDKVLDRLDKIIATLWKLTRPR